MPRITEETKTYPKGYFLSPGSLTIPEDAQFIIAQAADPIDGIFGNPGSYVIEDWDKQVTAVYNKGIPLGAMITVRVNGNDFSMDYINPDKDNSLIGYLYALKNKTYAFIVLMVITEDSDVATVKAARFYKDQLEKRTGKEVFLLTYKDMWESSESLNVELGATGSDWSLLMIGDCETEVGSAIETPGFWKMSSDTMFIWEKTPKVYLGFPPFGTTYKIIGVPEVEEPEIIIPGDEPDTEEPGSGESELVKELKVTNAILMEFLDVLNKIRG